MKQLFIDNHGVQRIHNLARKLHPLEKFPANAVVRPENRWENAGIQIRTTPSYNPEDGLFRMTYKASAEALDDAGLGPRGAPGGQSFTCYATSEDAINWEKSNLALFDYPGLTWRGTSIGTENNILFDENLRGAIFDPNADDPQERFKGLIYRGGELQPVASPDCIHWRDMQVPTLSSSDESHFSLDPHEKLFIAMVKHRGPYGRSFCLTTSSDFKQWSEQELVFHADQVDQENGFERLQKFFDDPAYLTPVYNRPEEWRTDVYNFPVFRYEGLYLGTPVMHHWAAKHPPLYENVDSRKSVELTCSRDLRHWERVANRATFLELSPVGDGSAYDTGQMVITNGPLVRNNELWFYYAGLRHRSLSIADRQNRAHLDGSAVCMAKLRMDGFVSLKGGIEWGSVTTTPIDVEGPALHVNVDSWRGRVKAEVLDAEEDRALQGYSVDESLPATVDSIDESMRWTDKQDLSELVGRTVRLRFSMLSGELYSYWFDS